MLNYKHKAKRNGYSLVVGVDEAGRGPLAGPVVAAAVAFQDYQFQNKITDSKKLTASQRERAYLEIEDKAYFGIGVVAESVIDSKNILEATYDAMNIAITRLMRRIIRLEQDQKELTRKTFLLIDGNSFKSDLPYEFEAIVKGDNLSLSIACASIIAKVTRDRILMLYDQILPQYDFRQHKGYPTLEHKRLIQQHGLSFIHRRTFNYL